MVLVATIKEIKDNFLVVYINDNVEVVIQKHNVTQILPKGTYKSIK